MRFNENTDAKEQGPHVATVTVDLLPAEERNARLDDVLSRWREVVGAVPDAVALTFSQPMFGPAGRAIEVRLQGDDLDVLSTEAEGVRAWFARRPGVEDLLVDLRPGKTEALVRLRPGARALGIDARSVAAQLRAAFHGSTAGEIQVGREDYEVDVRLAAADASSFGAIDAFYVTMPDGKQVPLGTVATVELDRGYARVARVDRQRTVTVTGDVDARAANTNELLARFERDVVPDLESRGVHVSLQGEVAEGGETQRSMLRALLIGLVGVFILLSYQFRSYLEPLVVMVAIPLALIGVIWGHKLLGLPFTMPSMLGFASLAGVVVNDSILLVAFIKRRRLEGADVQGRRASGEPRPVPGGPADLPHDDRRPLAAACRDESPGADPHPARREHRVRDDGVHRAGALRDPRALRHPG